MFELLSKINITSSSKDQVLEVLDKCNSLLIGGERDTKGAGMGNGLVFFFLTSLKLCVYV